MRLVAGADMGENLNETYRNIVEFLYTVSSSYFDKLGIEIVIEVPKDDKLNASVCRTKDNIYRIKIFPGCLNLDYKIQDITGRYTAEDLQFFGRVKHLSVFERFEDDTYREELNNLFATMILLHIFWHECGHILAKHVDGFVDMYEEYDSTRTGSYEMQEREMVADWLSTKCVFESMFYAIVRDDYYENKEILAILKQMSVLYWLSLTIEFQIFDSNHVKKINDYSTLTHPHPAVRLYYNKEAMRESLADILIGYGLNEESAEEGANLIIKQAYIYIQSFLGITNTPIDIRQNDPQIIDCYIKLRDIPYKNDAKKNAYVHLCLLSDEYRKKCEKYCAFQAEYLNNTNPNRGGGNL